MTYKNIYEVEFLTKKGGYVPWIIHVEENNLKAAVEKAKAMWAERNTSHMFHVKGRRVKDYEVIDYRHWFTRGDYGEFWSDKGMFAGFAKA